MKNIKKAIRYIESVRTHEVAIKVFAEILAKKPVLRFAIKWIESFKGSKLYTFILVLYVVKSILNLKAKGGGDILACSTTANEHSKVDYIKNSLADYTLENSSISNKNILYLPNVIHFYKIGLRYKNITQIFRLMMHFRQMDFIPACLIAAYLGYYIKFLHIMEQCPPRAVLVTSTYASDSMALICAAKHMNIPVILVPHANITEDYSTSNMHYDLAILSGKYASDILSQYNEHFSTQIVYSGVEGKTTALKLNRPIKTVGIFLTAQTNMTNLEKILHQIRKKFEEAAIVIRPHPVELVRPDFATLAGKSGITISPKGTRLDEDVSKVDLAIIGNSSVHLEVLKQGVPVVYYAGLDGYSHDVNGFVKNKIVPEIEDVNALNLEVINAFYTDPVWQEHYRYYDAGYGVAEEDMKENINRAIATLLTA